MVQSVGTAKQNGQQQFLTYSKDRLIDRTKTNDEPLGRNKVVLSTPNRRPKASKENL